MRKLLLVFCILLLNGASAQSFFDAAVAQEWSGEGTLFGSPATFRMSWSQVLGGQFHRLEFMHQRETAEGKIPFEAMGVYRTAEDQSVEGSWFDSRGMSLPLKGSVTDNQLIISWGTPETEQGKTIYTLREDGAIEVQDFVEKDGQDIAFGKAVYQ